MAFTRLPQVVVDYALGLQTINKAQANLDALLTAQAVEHSPLENRSAPPPGQEFGRHNTPKVPRAVVSIATSAQPGGGRTFSTSAGLTSSCVGAAAWIGTGICFLPVYGFSSFYAVCTPSATAGTQYRFVKSSPWYPTGQQAGLFFACYERGSSAMDLTNFDFCAAIYGQV